MISLVSHIALCAVFRHETGTALCRVCLLSDTQYPMSRMSPVRHTIPYVPYVSCQTHIALCPVCLHYQTHIALCPVCLRCETHIAECPVCLTETHIALCPVCLTEAHIAPCPVCLHCQTHIALCPYVSMRHT